MPALPWFPLRIGYRYTLYPIQVQIRLFIRVKLRMRSRNSCPNNAQAASGGRNSSLKNAWAASGDRNSLPKNCRPPSAAASHYCKQSMQRKAAPPAPAGPRPADRQHGPLNPVTDSSISQKVSHRALRRTRRHYLHSTEYNSLPNTALAAVIIS